MEIKFLDSIDFEVIHKAFLRAFSDYVVPLQPTLEQFSDFVIRRGIDRSVSIGAFDKEDLVGFNLNAIGMHYGSLTIYDSGTGTISEFRRSGIAEALFRYSLPYLKNRGAAQYILEVFRQNTAAVGLYEKIGFRTTRLLESFHRDNDTPCPFDSRFTIREIEPDWFALQVLWDWRPTWQNSIASIERSKMSRITLGVFLDQELAGYGIVFPESGDIPQFCIHRAQRRKGAATALFTHLQRLAGTRKLRTINMDSADEATLHFLQSQGFEHIGTQCEMKMDL